MFPIVLQDLRYGIRLLGRSPGFAAAATLSLALGIGANTTIFTLINAVLLHPLPVDEPSRLASIFRPVSAEIRQSSGVRLRSTIRPSPSSG
jgi:hypothetical protein